MYLLVSVNEKKHFLNNIMSIIKVIKDVIITMNDMISTLITISVTFFTDTIPILEIMSDNDQY